MSGFHGSHEHIRNDPYPAGDNPQQCSGLQYQSLPPASLGRNVLVPQVSVDGSRHYMNTSLTSSSSRPTGYAVIAGSHAGYTVTSYAPSQGAMGTQISIQLRCSRAISPDTMFTLTVEGMIETCNTSAITTDGVFQYIMVDAQMPPLEPSRHSRILDMALRIDDPATPSNIYVQVGKFSYSYNTSQQNTGTSADHTRKRRISGETYRSTLGPAKKTSAQQLQAFHREQSWSHTPTQSPVTSQHQLVVSSEVSSIPQPQNSIQGSTSQAVNASLYGACSNNVRVQGVPSANVFGANQDRHSKMAPAKSHITKDHPQSNREASDVADSSSRKSHASVHESTNPFLLRSSAMAAAPRVVDDLPQSFNPYTIYTDNKAFLEFVGDLDDMAEDWTEEEKQIKRRLVEFNREQDGNHVTASFKPVTLEDRIPNSICVSCIWWEEKDERYITSVDTIQLLESLVAVRFTTEEKNRIRRNLEGYKPLTVAKGKADSDAFFRVIMNFPPPKPRNIEKDVKVFSWKILKHALQKIMGKYSASYASTASQIPQNGQVAADAPRQAAAGHHEATGAPTSATPTGSPSPTPAEVTPHQAINAPSFTAQPAPINDQWLQPTQYAGEGHLSQARAQSTPLFTMPSAQTPQLSFSGRASEYSHLPHAPAHWSQSNYADTFATSLPHAAPTQWQYDLPYAGSSAAPEGTYNSHSYGYYDSKQTYGQSTNQRSPYDHQ